MSAHCNTHDRRIKMVFIRDAEIVEESFDSWVELADFINLHGFEGKNIHVIAWEFDSDEQTTP